jgi:hypothetical protein
VIPAGYTSSGLTLAGGDTPLGTLLQVVTAASGLPILLVVTIPTPFASLLLLYQHASLSACEPQRRVLSCLALSCTSPWKSDLRGHQAIIQPRLYDCLMATQITLKTDSPHGLLSGRLPAEVDPPCGEAL